MIPLPPYLPFFAGFAAFTPEIPKLYWDVKSQEQRYFTLCKEIHKLICYVDSIADNVNIDHAAIQELQDLFDKFMQSGFDDYYAQQVEKWIDEHMQLIIQVLYTKMIWFGLTDDGYFSAYMLDGLTGVTFDTGAVYGNEDYGRLILKTNVNGYVNEMRKE